MNKINIFLLCIVCFSLGMSYGHYITLEALDDALTNAFKKMVEEMR